MEMLRCDAKNGENPWGSHRFWAAFAGVGAEEVMRRT